MFENIYFEVQCHSKSRVMSYTNICCVLITGRRKTRVSFFTFHIFFVSSFQPLHG